MEHSRLGKLAAELRIRIYEMVLVQNEPIYLLKTVKGLSRFSPNQQPQILSLLSVCRQTQQECAGLFYSQNSFTLPQPTMNGFGHSLKSFIAAIGSRNVDSLRKVTVQMNATHKYEGFRNSGHVERALLGQLYALEEQSLAHPQLRLRCTISMWYHRAITIDGVHKVELNMTDWSSSKKEARKKLEPSMRSEHQPTGDISTAEYLMKILDEYESIREEN